MTIGPEVASALKWSSVGKLGAQLISWVVTLLVLRILTPADYGLLAIATVGVSLVMMLGEVGVQLIVVRARDLSERFMQSVFGLVIISHLLVALCIALLAVPVAHYYGETRIQPIMTTVGLNALLVALTQIPGALLLREMNFRAQAMVAMSGSLVQSVTTLALAHWGAGVWALVLGQLVATAFIAVVLNMLRPSVRVPSFDFSRLRGDLLFGSWIVIQRATWWLLNSFDQLLLGKLVGPIQLGYYAVANQIASLPKDKLSQIVNQITFPAVTRLRSDLPRLRANLLTALGIMSMVVFPIFALISALAEDIVATVLTSKWQGALAPLILLPLAMPFRMIAGPIAEALNALGHASTTAKVQAASLASVLVGISLGSLWGVIGVCAAWVVLANLNLAFFTVATRRLSGIGYCDLIGVMLRPVACSALMYAAVGISRRLMSLVKASPFEHGPSRLAVFVAIATVVYVGTSMMLNRRGMRDLMSLLGQGSGVPRT